MPNIVLRLASFKKALGAVVSCGLARGRRSNPAASLRILSIYGTPVLMSGLASLLLSDTEISCIDQQFKRTLQNILKLSVNSPPSLVHFIAGSLPGTAILHLKYLTLFGMVCRLQNNPINLYAKHILQSAAALTSWFGMVRNILRQYQLPHPLVLLQNPPTKEVFKNLVKSKVVDFWEIKLRSEASVLLSLPYFQPHYMSLRSTHKLLTTAGPKSYEVSKARIQLLFLSSQYPSANFSRHWSQDNPLGICSFPVCQENAIVESSEHILLFCPAYNTTRQSLLNLCLKTENQHSHQLVTSFLFSGPTKTMQFLLYCSAIPEVISTAQHWDDSVYKDLFYLSRTWCFAVHRERMKRLCKWNFY
jgi:hypothetical protein